MFKRIFKKANYAKPMSKQEAAFHHALRVIGEFENKTNYRGEPYIEPLDVVGAHAGLDELMCEILLEHGYGELVNLFRMMTKWYE